MNIITNGMIKIDRLFKDLPENFEWNLNERVKLEDIEQALKKGQLEETNPFNPNVPMPYKWHIGRIIYFINHPDEIEYIIIENVHSDSYCFPTPLIVEGYHRFFAAVWLHMNNKLTEVYCFYKGRSDIFFYLNGRDSKKPTKTIKFYNEFEERNYCIVNSKNEFYYTFTDDEVLFTDDIRKAFKLSESAANNLIEMFEKCYHGVRYKIMKEDIKNTIWY